MGLRRPDFLFLLSLVSPLFFLSSCLSSSLHLSSLSLEREKKKVAPGPPFLKQASLPLSLSASHLCFLIFFHTHPHTIPRVGKQQPIQHVAYSPRRRCGDQSHDSVVLITGLAFPGQDAGIFIAADKGSSKT